MRITTDDSFVKSHQEGGGTMFPFVSLSRRFAWGLCRTENKSTALPTFIHMVVIVNTVKKNCCCYFQVNNGVVYLDYEDSHHHGPLLCSFQLLYWILSLLFDDVLFCLPFCWCPCMAINVSVQYDGGFLPDIMLLTQCYYHRGTRLNAMKRFCVFSY